MARPKKNKSEIRDNRLTIYLTDLERQVLNEVATIKDRPLTQIVILAVRDWIERLSEPPIVWRRAKHEKTMQQEKEHTRGYVCKNGHPFWIEWATATEPRYCPVCGSTADIKRTWDGIVKKGL